MAATGTAISILSNQSPSIKAGDRVFLLGDSLAVGLRVPLSRLMKEHGVELAYLAKEGTRIDQWAGNAELLKAISSFKPTLILVSLGTNDEYMNLDAGSRQEPHLKKLLESLRSVAPVAWIGPPTLPKSGSNGAIPLILKNVPSSNYFPSQKLSIPRANDKIHPTTAGYAGWAGEIWKWLQ